MYRLIYACYLLKILKDGGAKNEVKGFLLRRTKKNHFLSFPIHHVLFWFLFTRAVILLVIVENDGTICWETKRLSSADRCMAPRKIVTCGGTRLSA